jgi:hypothetical protein
MRKDNSDCVRRHWLCESHRSIDVIVERYREIHRKRGGEREREKGKFHLFRLPLTREDLASNLVSMARSRLQTYTTW